MRLTSFDIFDTVLYRKCGEAENVFALVALRLFPNDEHKRDMFFAWRRSAPNYVKQGKKDYTTIKEIYSHKGIAFFTEYTPEQMMQAELDVESEMLTKNQDVVNIISVARKTGDAVAFISDMYLPSDFLCSVLKREGVFKEGDRIYVSCEEKARKDDGELYDKVREELKPESWMHYGDNESSDINQAKAKGINAVKVEVPYSDAEKKLLDVVNLCPMPKLLSALAGFSRYVRLSFGDDSKAQLGADIVAPCYVGYVAHVLEDAKKRGIKTLYFLSRDSYILLKIAEVLPHDGIELKYLFVSRKSLTLPYLYNGNKETLLAIQRENNLHDKNIDNILLYMGVTREDLGLTGLHKKLENPEDEESFVKALFSDQTRQQLGLEERYNLCDGYLRQEGVYDDNVALVDVGWLGTTRLMINSLRERNGKGQLFSYYFGVENCALSPLYGNFDYVVKGVSQSGWNCFVVEDYFSACHYTSTIGYAREGGKIVPTFKNGIKEIANPIEEANIPIVVMMAELLAKYNIPADACYTWVLNSYAFVSDTDNYIDYSFFAEHNENDEFSMRKLTKKELWQVVKASNDSPTSNMNVALDVTLGRKGHERLKKVQKVYTSLRKVFWVLTLKKYRG